MGHADLETRKRSARSRLAALIPLPLLRPRGDQDAAAAGTASQPGLFAAHLSASVGALEPLSAGWTKAAATVVAIAAGGMGTGMATQGDPLAVVHKAVGLIAAAPERPQAETLTLSSFSSLPAGELLRKPQRKAPLRSRAVKAAAASTTPVATGPSVAPASTAPSAPLPAAPQDLVKVTSVTASPAQPKAAVPDVSHGTAAPAPQDPPTPIAAVTSGAEPVVESTGTALRATVSVVNEQTDNVGGAAAKAQTVSQAK